MRSKKKRTSAASRPSRLWMKSIFCADERPSSENWQTSCRCLASGSPLPTPLTITIE